MLRPATKMLLVFLVASQAFATPIKDDPAAPDAAPVAAAAAPASDKAPAEAPATQQENKVKDAPAPAAEKPADTPAANPPAGAEEPRDGRVLNNVETVGEREQAILSKLNSKCSQREVSSCVMLKMVTYINKLLKKANIQVTEGLEISQTEAVVEEDLPPVEAEGEGARGLDEEEESEEVQVGQLIANKVWAFVKSRSLRWNIFPEADVVLSASPDNEGALNLGLSMRAGKAVEMARKKNNNMGPLLAAGVMKLGLIGGVAFKALALLVGKALILSKIAFLLGAILWLKKLFSQQRHVTYEVVAHPHHSHSHVASDAHGHGHDSYVGSSGWGRQLGAAPGAAAAAAPAGQDLAYRAHAPTAAAAGPAASART